MAYDVLEDAGDDIRATPLVERRRGSRPSSARLRRRTSRAAHLRGGAPLLPFEDDGPAPPGRQERSACRPSLDRRDLDALADVRGESRRRGVEGLMLKRLAPPTAGRKRGDWWKWKIDPHTIDAVLIYAQRARASAPACSPTTPSASGTTASWCRWRRPIGPDQRGDPRHGPLDRRHTLERFGPVRHVEPIHVFELGFEAIAVEAAQVRHRGALPAHAALAQGQAGERGRHAGHARSADADGDPAYLLPPPGEPDCAPTRPRWAAATLEPDQRPAVGGTPKKAATGAAEATARRAAIPTLT